MASVAIHGEISWETDDSPGKFVCYTLLMTVVHRITAWFGLDETLKLFMLLLMPLATFNSIRDLSFIFPTPISGCSDNFTVLLPADYHEGKGEAVWCKIYMIPTELGNCGIY